MREASFGLYKTVLVIVPYEIVGIGTMVVIMSTTELGHCFYALDSYF